MLEANPVTETRVTGKKPACGSGSMLEVKAGAGSQQSDEEGSPD